MNFFSVNIQKKITKMIFLNINSLFGQNQRVFRQIVEFLPKGIFLQKQEGVNIIEFLIRKIQENPTNSLIIFNF
jgi:hypothetical protein